MVNPQMVMYEEEFNQIQSVVDRLVKDANAKVVFIVDKNGNPIELTRRANGRKMGGGDRRYTYQNIKDMADALHREEIFNQSQRDLVHQRVEAFEQSIHEAE